jgi:hypothetical protein
MGELRVLDQMQKVRHGARMSTKRHYSGKQKAALFFTYWAFAAAVVALAAINVEFLMRPISLILLGIGSLVFALVSTIVHVRQGKQNAIDDIAKRM